MDPCAMQSQCWAFDETSAQIKPCHVFGVCKGVRNNLLFPNEETVIFPSGNHCVRYHIHEQWTQFIHGVKGSKGMQALALSPDKCYLAVSESGTWGNIYILDLEDEKCCKRQVLKGSDYGVQEFVWMAFSTDSKYLLGQAGGPTWTIFCWKWEEKELISSQATRNGRDSQVSFNPSGTQICASGRGIFKIFNLKNGSLNKAFSYKMENVLCHVWMSDDCIIAGTEAGGLLMLKSGHMHKLERPCVRQTEKRDSPSSLAELASVTAITRHSTGFACSAGPGLVCLYEETKAKDNYRKTAEIRIPLDPYSSQPLQMIATLCISPAEETLAISTDQGQLYHINLTPTEISKSEEVEFRFLCHSLHSESITGLSICATKPLIITCSKDSTIHIWNYKTKSLEQFKEFDEEPLCVAMHPNGLSVLVGFSTEILYLKILHDNITTVQKFTTSNCTKCVFNHDGNRFAAISKNAIHIYNVRTNEKLDLKGHRDKVQSVKWSNDDFRLVSCGMDGAIFIWNALTSAVESKNMDDCSYADVTFSPNTGSILAVDQIGLREIHDNMILCEMASDGVAYTAISVTRSGRTVFVGTTTGTVRVIKYPFKKEKALTDHRAHSGPITKMVVTPCDRFLVTASEDGSLLIWTITDQGGQTLVKEIDYTEDVLCTKTYLEEKDQIVHELKSQIEWLKVEQEYTMNMKDKDCHEKINSIMQNYLQEIDELKDQIQMLNKETEDQEVSHQKELTELMEKHTEELKDRELSHVNNLTESYEEQNKLEQKRQMIQQNNENLEKQLNEAEDSHLRAMEDTKQGYDTMLQELQAKLEQEVRNSEEKQKKIKEDAESELRELCCDYEHDLLVEKKSQQTAQDKLNAMERNISQDLPMKRKIKNQDLKISKLEEEVQNLTVKFKDAKESFWDLTKEKEEQNKTISDQEQYIEELQEVIKNLKMNCEQKQEKLDRMILKRKKAEEHHHLKCDKDRSEVERLEKTIQEHKEIFNMIGGEMEEAKCRYRKTIADQKQKLKSNAQALLIETQRVINANILVHRMKGDIHNCTRFIQDPKKLKENFIELHTRYIHKPDETIKVDAEVIQEQSRHMHHLQNILDSEKRRRAREIKLEDERCAKLVRENSLLIKQLREQKERNQELLTSLDKKRVQCVDTRASSANLKPRPVFQCQLPINKTRGQISAQRSPGHVKLPTITNTMITRDVSNTRR